MRILIKESDGTLGCMVVTYISYDTETKELWFAEITDIWKVKVSKESAMNMIRDLFRYGYLDASYLIWELEE